MPVNIKISELDAFPSASDPIAYNDFFPLVNSSSMTTYRVGVTDLGSALQSLQPPSTLATWASSSVSSSFASRSISASHADFADLAKNVQTYGYQYYFPYWNTNLTPGSNGALAQSSYLYESHSNDSLKYARVIVIDKSSAEWTGYTPNPTYRPDYSVFPYWNYKQNFWGGNAVNGAGGLFTVAPMISAYGFMTDQASWRFVTGSYPLDPITYPQDTHLTKSYLQTFYWSGSSNPVVTPASGFYAIGHGPGALSSSFNGKWVRLVCSSNFGCGVGPDSCTIASGSAYGEVPIPSNGFFGRVRLAFGTIMYNGGTNSNQVIDMHIHNGMWGGGISAQVFHSNFYGYDHIRKLRLSIWTARSSVNEDKLWNDPMFALDIFIDKLTENDYDCWIQAQSWGGIRFLTQPNVDPPPLFDTGSSQYPPYSTNGYFDPKTATYLIFPPAPGYYSTVGDRQGQAQGSALQPYFFQGKKVQIDPNRNMITESAWWLEPTLNYKPYSLWVSGSISTHRYWAEDDGGQSGQLVAYNPVTSEWGIWTHKGGILTYSGSTAITPGDQVPRDTVGIGTIMAFAGPSANIPPNWIECDGRILATSSYWDLHRALYTTNASADYGWTCTAGGAYSPSGLYFKIPDLRGMFVRGWDHSRGEDSGRIEQSRQADAFRNHSHTTVISGHQTSGTNLNSYHLGLGVQSTTNWVSQTAGDSETRPKNIAMCYIIKYSNAISFATAGTPLAGDVTGVVSSNTVNKIRSVTVSSTAPSNGQVLTYNAGALQWEPQTPASIASSQFNRAKSWWAANPGGALVHPNGQSLYVFNYNRHNNRTCLSKINMDTNAVTFVAKASQWNGTSYQWDIYGRMFNTRNVPAVTGSIYKAYYFSGMGGHVFDVATENITHLRNTNGNTIGSGYVYDLPVSISFTESSGSQPTIWALNGSYYGQDYPIFQWRKIYWSAGTWTNRLTSEFPGIMSSSIDLRYINNSTEFLKFFCDFPTISGNGAEALMWDYNYFKKRLYLVDTGNGYLHIITHTGLWPATDIKDYTYEKTLAIPIASGEIWTNAATEKMYVDYDPDTGDERGIVHVRRGNTSFNGAVEYIYWPEV